MDANQEIIRLIRARVCEGQPAGVSVAEEDIPLLLKAAEKHSLDQLLCTCGVDSPETRIRENKAKYRFLLSDFEFRRICTALEEQRIVFLPLKGIVIKNDYPEPWMRSHGDIDILTRDPSGAEAVMLSLGYVRRGETDHDASYYLPDGSLHIELAHTLCIGMNSQWDDGLAKVWDYTEKASGREYQRVMKPEFFYFYHIAHMAKHFSEGGVGIRFVLDLWIMRHRAGICGDELCASYGLGRFNDGCVRLSEKWFSGAELELPEGLEQAIADGGVYGAMKLKIVYALRKKSPVRYILSRLFPSFRYMASLYPVLNKHKWLLPVMYIARFFRPFACIRSGKHMKSELSAYRRTKKEDVTVVDSMLEQLGLNTHI